MFSRGQVDPYASATVEALRSTVDESSFLSKFSDVAIELNVWVASELYKIGNIKYNLIPLLEITRIYIYSILCRIREVFGRQMPPPWPRY